MKKIIYLKRLAAILASILCLALISTCSEEKTDDSQLSIPYEASPTTFNIVFINSATGEPIGINDNKTIKISFSGKDASLVSDISGLPSTEFKTDKGFIALSLSPNIIPSAANPITFSINTEAEDFLPSHLSMRITSASHGNYEVKMVDKNNLPSGITLKENNSGLANNGSLASEISLQTDYSGINQTKATLNLPQNIVLKDKDGNKLDGALKVSLTYFNNRDSSTADYFPGGGMVSPISNNGITSPSMMYSAGYVNINVTDASGRKATKVENGTVSTFIEVPQGTYNPKTNMPVVAGDSIPLLSYEESSGKWIFERNEAVKMQGGKLVINSSLSHFSYYNWDFIEPGCYSGSVISFKSNTIPQGTSISIYVKAIRMSDGYVIGSLGSTGPYMVIDQFDGTDKLNLNMVSNSPFKVVAYNYSNNQEIGSVTLDNPCSSNNYDLFLNLGYVPPKDSIVLNVKAFCPLKPNVQILPSLSYWYKDMSVSTAKWFPGWMKNGRTLLWLKKGHVYKFVVNFGGKTSIISFTMGDPQYNNYTYNIPLPPFFCL